MHDNADSVKPFPIPLKVDPMVPPGTVEWRDGDRLIGLILSTRPGRL